MMLKICRSKQEWLCLAGIALMISSAPLRADEWEVSVGAEVRYFPEDGLYETAGDRWALNMEFENHWVVLGDQEYPVIANLDAQLRHAGSDDDRQLADFSALNLSQFRDGWEWVIGMDKVFWGVAESQNIVNVINQVDIQASPDGKDRLGQLMGRLSVHSDEWGSWDILLMPLFQARDFSNMNGRLALPLPVMETDAYESHAEKHHLDFASRWSHQWGDITTGLAYFSGTDREPELRVAVTNPNQPSLVISPFYAQMKQVGFDAQWILGEWLLKAEAIYKDTDQQHYWASISGVEYTFGQIWESSYDLSWYLEYLHDDRQEQAPAGALENDWMLASRLSFNDEASSSILVAVFNDVDSQETIVKSEASYRVTDNLSLGLELWVFDTGPSYSRDFSARVPAQIMESQTYGKQAFLNNEDFLQLAFTYYF